MTSAIGTGPDHKDRRIAELEADKRALSESKEYWYQAANEAHARAEQAEAALERITDEAARRIMEMSDEEIMAVEIKEVGRDAAAEIAKWTSRAISNQAKLVEVTAERDAMKAVVDVAVEWSGAYEHRGKTYDEAPRSNKGDDQIDEAEKRMDVAEETLLNAVTALTGEDG